MNRSVLIIDDMADMRECLREFFCRAGFMVTAAENGELGLKYLSSNCDLIILDLNMPVMDGYQFIQMKSLQRHWDHIPIIVFSGESDAHALNGKAGVISVWPKTSDLTELVNYVKSITSHRLR